MTVKNAYHKYHFFKRVYLGLNNFLVVQEVIILFDFKNNYQMSKGPHFLGMHGSPCDDTVSNFRMTSYENIIVIIHLLFETILVNCIFAQQS
jgi:hypothetical protein